MRSTWKTQLRKHYVIYNMYIIYEIVKPLYDLCLNLWFKTTVYIYDLKFKP